MGNLADEVLGVVQRRTKAQRVGIKLGQEAVVVHQIEGVLFAPNHGQQILAYSLDQAHVWMIRVAGKKKKESQLESIKFEATIVS